MGMADATWRGLYRGALEQLGDPVEARRIVERASGYEHAELTVALHYAFESFPWTFLNPHFVSRFQRLAQTDETITANARLEKSNHFIVDRTRLVVETHNPLHAASESDFVTQRRNKARENITRK